MIFHSPSLALSGERFTVVYRLVGSQAEARAKAKDICLEDTVEISDDLVPDGDIRTHVLGRIESFRPLDDEHCEAIISYAIETVGQELTQLLNVIFGNISLKPGIRVERLDLPDSLLRVFRGPRFGREGLRAKLDAPERPLVSMALKPMGLSAKALADLAFQCALGGIDIIKDDHGLADQSFAPFRDRVAACVEAVERANRQTGYRCIYVPNVTSAADQVIDKALFARQAGAGGLLVSPALVGLDTMRCLADDNRIALPILSHPTFQGSYVASAENGISHLALYGQINRLAGADVVIFPNWGGRFSFTRQECQSIVDGTRTPMGHVKPILSAAGGGMNLARVPEMREVYGRDIIFLIGSGLYRHGPDLVENSRYFRQLVDKI